MDGQGASREWQQDREVHELFWDCEGGEHTLCVGHETVDGTAYACTCPCHPWN